MAITTNMGLTTWGPNDYFNDLDLKTNWEKVDAHDHDPSNDGGVRIGSNGINNNAIVESKIADSAVTDEKIANGTITKFKLANDLVVALEKAAEALSIDTVFGTATTATVTGDYENLKLKDGSIVDTHVAEGAQISPSKIKIVTQSGSPLSSSNGVIDTNAVSSNGGVRGPFNSLNIQPNAVGEGQMADGAVTTSKLYTGAVTSDKIANGTIATADLSSSVSGGLTTTPAGWTAYTPAFGYINGTVLSGGDRRITGAFQIVHNTVFVRINVGMNSGLFWLGSSSAVTFGLPRTAAATAIGGWTWNYGFAQADYGNAIASSDYVILRGSISYEGGESSSGGPYYRPANIDPGIPGQIKNVGQDGFINIWDTNTNFDISIAYQTA